MTRLWPDKRTKPTVRKSQCFLDFFCRISIGTRTLAHLWSFSLWFFWAHAHAFLITPDCWEFSNVICVGSGMSNRSLEQKFQIRYISLSSRLGYLWNKLEFNCSGSPTVDFQIPSAGLRRKFRLPRKDGLFGMEETLTVFFPLAWSPAPTTVLPAS